MTSLRGKMSLDIKKKSRKVLRMSFTKCATELEALLLEFPLDLEKVQACREILQEKSGELKVADEDIFEKLLAEDADESDLCAEKDGCDGYNRRAKQLIIRSSRLEAVRTPTEVDNHSSQGSSAETDVTSGKRKFKLPVIQFKRFDGNVRDWLSFWALFRKVHEDTDIGMADKIEYLVQSTVPGSRARHLVESFPATGENYPKIIDSLKSRFGRDDLQIEVYIRELLKLILNNAMSKGKIDISNLYDNIETQLRSLETLGIKSDKYSAMLFPLIESCLPEELLRVWQRSSTALCAEIVLVIKSNVTLENRLKALLQFLGNKVENEERICLAAEGFGIHELRHAAGGPSRRRITQGSTDKLPHEPATASALINQGVSSGGRVSTSLRCIFCEGSHESPNCLKASSYDLEKKRRVIAEKGDCFRCLKVGHPIKKYRAYVKCLVCSRGHVTLMCPDLKTN